MKKMLVLVALILTMVCLMPTNEVKAECRCDFTIEELDGVFTIYYEQLKAHKEELTEDRYDVVYRYLYNVYYRCKNLAEYEKYNNFARIYCYNTALDLDELADVELYTEFTLDELVGFEVPPFIKEDLRKQSSFYSVFHYFLFIYPFSVVKRVNILSK